MMDKKILFAMLVIFSVFCSVILTKTVSPVFNGGGADCSSCDTWDCCVELLNCEWNTRYAICEEFGGGPTGCQYCEECETPEECSELFDCKWEDGFCQSAIGGGGECTPYCPESAYEDECDQSAPDGCGGTCTRSTAGKECTATAGVNGVCVSGNCQSCSSTATICAYANCGGASAVWTADGGENNCCGDDPGEDYCSGGYTACYNAVYYANGDSNSYTCSCDGSTYRNDWGTGERRCCGDDGAGDVMSIAVGSTCYFCFKGNYGIVAIPADYCDGDIRKYDAQCTYQGVTGWSTQDCNSLDTCVNGQATFRDYYCSQGRCDFTDRDRDSGQAYCTTSAGVCDALIWSGTSCCGDDSTEASADGGTCTSDANCCYSTNRYCADGHCCQRGWRWTVDGCTETNPCYPTGGCNSAPFSTGWWSNAGCIDSSIPRACCNVGLKYGQDPYYDYSYASGIPCVQPY